MVCTAARKQEKGDCGIEKMTEGEWRMASVLTVINSDEEARQHSHH